MPGISLRRVRVNGAPGALYLDARQHVHGVISLEIAGGHIHGVRSIVNPDKLTHLGPVGDYSSLLGSVLERLRAPGLKTEEAQRLTAHARRLGHPLD
jgi:hypothetical protein